MVGRHAHSVCHPADTIDEGVSWSRPMLAVARALVADILRADILRLVGRFDGLADDSARPAYFCAWDGAPRVHQGPMRRGPLVPGANTDGVCRDHSLAAVFEHIYEAYPQRNAGVYAASPM